MDIYEDPNQAIHATTVRSSSDLAALLAESAVTGPRFVIKVNWFGPEYGYYSDARTLDFVLEALPTGEKILVEGHAYGRNDGSREIDWRDLNQVSDSRKWIQEQDRWFLDSTGLSNIISKHNATYINITDEVWSGRTVDPQKVKALVEDRFTPVLRDDLYSYVPSRIWDLRGADLISLSRIKLRSTNALAIDESPYSPIFSLSMKNLFGLIPDPFRFSWHGTNGKELAQSILDINKIYASLFDVIGLNEGIFYLLVNDPRGMYETNWGNYDILEDHGLVLISRDLITLDAYTARSFFPIDWARWTFFELAEPDFGSVDESNFPPIPSEIKDLVQECNERYLISQKQH